MEVDGAGKDPSASGPNCCMDLPSAHKESGTEKPPFEKEALRGPRFLGLHQFQVKLSQSDKKLRFLITSNEVALKLMDSATPLCFLGMLVPEYHRTWIPPLSLIYYHPTTTNP